MVVGDILINNTNWFPDRVGMIDGLTGVRYTWRQANARVNSMSHALIDLGVKKGDRVGIISDNCIECGEFQFATA